MIVLQYRIFLLLAPLSALAALGTLAYAYRRRSSAPRQISALAWLVAALVGWLALNCLELLASSSEATLRWAQITYLFVSGSIVAWIAFALEYAGQERWLTPTHFAGLCAIPAVTVLLALTNSWHNLIWTAYDFMPIDGLLTMRVLGYGKWFMVHTTYAYFAVLGGAFLISRQYFRSFRFYRQQSGLVLLGAVMPLAANLIYLSGIIPGQRQDFTSISFALAAAAFAVGILRYRLFDLGPIAREVVVDSMADVMVTLDTLDRVVDLNPAARHLLAKLKGEDRGEDWIGRPAAQLPPPWPSLAEGPSETSRQEGDVAFDLDGDQHDYDVRISPLVDRRGHLAGRTIVLREVTARKRAEEKLRTYALELEAQNRELDAFAHMVAHDLKHPVSVMVTCAEWLRENCGEIPEREMVETVEAMVTRGHEAGSIVDSLLLLARLRNLDEVVLEPLDMGGIVATALAHLAPQCEESRAQIVAPPAWPPAVGYAPWVEQVWANYLSNALKYGGRPDQGLSPRIELGFDETSGRQARFWVRDNGPGLTPETQALLFTEFSRLAETGTRGHGLGLAIVRRIVEKLGGEVGVESQQGEGSTFWFTLPRDGNALAA
jgi:signal transduction histidine kinase